jgi:iron complex transport system substrate-binding protein
MPLRLHVPRAGRLPLAAAALVMLTLIGVAMPAIAAVFTDAAGRRVNLPGRITRILPAERNAEVLVYALTPDKLVGLERLAGGKATLRGVERLPVLHFRQDGTPESVARAALDYRADLILDAGPVTPERAVFADAVQQRSGIPYILVYDGFDRLQQVLPSLGALLGASERGTICGSFSNST